MAERHPVVDPKEWQESYHTRYDPQTDGELVTALVRAVATAKGIDPLDSEKLPPLYDTIDAAYLEHTVIASSGVRNGSEDGRLVSFQYAECTVTVNNGGEITIYEKR